MSTFLHCFMWFMIGDTVGLLTLLFWQGVCSLNKDEPVRSVTRFDQVTQSPEALADFVESLRSNLNCEVCIYQYLSKSCICLDCSCHEGIIKYLNQELRKE